MAKVTKKVTKKRKRKTLNADRHIFRHHSITQSLQLQIQKVTHYHGQVLVVLVLKVQGNLLLMQLRWQLKLLQRQL